MVLERVKNNVIRRFGYVIEAILKGKYNGVLVSFVKNDEIKPSISCQIILE